MTTRARPSRRWRLLAPVSAVLLAVTLGVDVAGAAPSTRVGMPAPGRAQGPAAGMRWDLQARLEGAAERIRSLAAAKRLAGYAGAVAQPEAGKVRLYWHGAVPRDVAAQASAESGVSVELRPAAYSLDALVKEARRLMAADPGQVGARITRVGPLPDASGLLVGVDPASARRGMPTVRSSVRTVVQVAPAFRAMIGDRQNDSSPWYGGSRIRRGSAGCTSAFPARRNSDGASVLITAAHCGAGTWSTPTGRTIGISSASTRNQSIDGMYIVTNEASGNRIYRGSFTTADSIPVRGSSDVVLLGNQVCVGGSYSGQVCTLLVTATNQFVNLQGFGTVGPGTIAEEWNRQGASGEGDSGGPAYGYADRGSRVSAKGIITGGDPSAPAACTGVPAGSGRSCSWRIFYVNIGPTLNSFGLTVNTG